MATRCRWPPDSCESRRCERRDGSDGVEGRRDPVPLVGAGDPETPPVADQSQHHRVAGAMALPGGGIVLRDVPDLGDGTGIACRPAQHIRRCPTPPDEPQDHPRVPSVWDLFGTDDGGDTTGRHVEGALPTRSAGRPGRR